MKLVLNSLSRFYGRTQYLPSTLWSYRTVFGENIKRQARLFFINFNYLCTVQNQLECYQRCSSTATTTDLGIGLMVSWFCIYYDVANPKIGLNLVPNLACAGTSSTAMIWRPDKLHRTDKNLNTITIDDINNNLNILRPSAHCICV